MRRRDGRKTWSLKKLGRCEAAIAVCDEGIAKYGADLSITIEKDIAWLLVYKAGELDKLGRHDEELATYDEIIRRWEEASLPELRQRVSKARFDRAITLVDLGRIDEAIEAYTQGAGDIRASDVKTATNGACSANNLGILLRKNGRVPEAISWHQRVLDTCDRDHPGLREQIGVAHGGLARAYVARGDNQRALAAMDAALAMPAGTYGAGLPKALAEERAALAPVPAKVTFNGPGMKLIRWIQGK